MSEVEQGHTAWSRNMRTPLREFLRTETGGAAVLLGAALAAVVWANVDAGSYERVWTATLSIRVGGGEIAMPLRGWIDSGLMTFFFFVVGLEARREFDLGELRDRRRSLVPLLAGGGGIVAAIGIYLAFNAGRDSAHGWGAAMSTDTAFALGLLAVVGPRHLDRLRAFLLTLLVVDDIVALVVIATVYTDHLRVTPLLLGLIPFAGFLVMRHFRLRIGIALLALVVVEWICVYESGVDPLVVGLVTGLLVFAFPPPRPTLERASDTFRRFREQPTAELARSVSTDLRSATSYNERLQALYHPWTSYAVVPLFALANTGIAIDGELLRRAASSPITLGIVCGFVAGKPLGIVTASWLGARLTRGAARPPVGWAALGGSGTIAGIGFTVSLLVATLAFDGADLEEAKVGIFASAACAALVTWLLFRLIAMLPKRRRARALLGTFEPLEDLAVPVDPEHDHVRGPLDAKVTLVEYGDFECEYCGRAETIIRELLGGFGDVAYVWRHLPLNDVHPHAQLAAEASEAAAAQGAFWPMHDLLLDHQGDLEPGDLFRYAEELELDVDRFARDLHDAVGATRIAEDVDSADLSSVTGTPTFFINGRRHFGAYDIETLSAAVKTAGARALLVR